jgi:hypothetical protein
MLVKEKISALLAELNTGIYEKEEVMALALLSSKGRQTVPEQRRGNEARRNDLAKP